MPSRFVYEGDIKPGEDGKFEKTSKIEELHDIRKEEVLDEEVSDPKERKSLYEQLQISRRNRYQQKKKELEDQNSSYKLRHDDLTYYNELEARKKAALIKEREDEESALKEFREKQRQSKLKGISKPAIKKRKGSQKIEPKLKELLNGINSLEARKSGDHVGLDLGYASSDSDD